MIIDKKSKMKRDGTWDLFITKEIAEWYLELKKKGAYYWKINLEQSGFLIRMLCNAYNVTVIPELISDTHQLKRANCVGFWRTDGRGKYTINVFPRCHMKTVIHEVYHHIDYMTKGYYNSSDYKNYAWQFAELYFQSLTKIKDLSSGLIIHPKESTKVSVKESPKASIAIWPKETPKVSVAIWPKESKETIEDPKVVRSEEPIEKEQEVIVKLTKLKVKLGKKNLSEV